MDMHRHMDMHSYMWPCAGTHGHAPKHMDMCDQHGGVFMFNIMSENCLRLRLHRITFVEFLHEILRIRQVAMHI